MTFDPKPCVYCGEPADSIDHTVPRHLLKRAGELELDLSKLFRMKDWTLPACRECNSAIGGRIFRTLAERRECAREHLRRKYAAYLRIPHWTEAEIAQMGPLAQQDIRKGVRVRDRIRERLQWSGTRDVEWTGDVYMVMREILGSRRVA